MYYSCQLLITNCITDVVYFYLSGLGRIMVATKGGRVGQAETRA
jgi:hypothetical protein